MLRNLFLSILIYSISGINISAQTLQSPQNFIGDDYGIQFTPHHQLVSYFKHVNEVSDRVSMEQYGETNEGRPLYLVYVTSENNQKDIENYLL